MTMLEGVFTGGLIVTILASLAMLVFLFRLFTKRSQLTHLPRIKKAMPPKKKRRIREERQQLSAQKKRSLLYGCLSLVVALIFASGSIYVSYYQSMNLAEDDSDSLVKGYYLLRDFKKELEEASTNNEDKEKLQKNIRYLGTAMASYGTKKASGVNTEEGQLILNRYYTALKELGMNSSTQTNNFYENEPLVTEFLEDSGKVETYEKAAFAYYKVDEALLSESK